MSNQNEQWLKQARRIVADLFERKVWIYWVDFLVSLTIGYGAALFLIHGTVPWRLRWVAYLVAVPALYRSSIFMHEISHFKPNEMRGFKAAWNLLAGIPMLVPSFFYESHLDHHKTKHYGTEADGEYLPLGSGSTWHVLAFFTQIFYLPLLTVFRFLVLTPLSLLIPRLRKWVLEHWSSFVINLSYRREMPDRPTLKSWLLVELLCSARAWAIPLIAVAGLVPWYNMFLLYALAIGVLSLNHLRTLAAHRYLSDGQTMTYHQQILDSTDIASASPWTLLLCPLGLRFHALHHLFPGLPYHNLATAHRRLVSQLPGSAPYHQVVYPNLSAVFKEFSQAVRLNGLAAAKRACHD